MRPSLTTTLGTEHPPQPDRVPEPDTPPPANTVCPPKICFEQLAAGNQEVVIEHHGQLYRLRVTRNDKLILGK